MICYVVDLDTITTQTQMPRRVVMSVSVIDDTLKEHATIVLKMH